MSEPNISEPASFDELAASADDFNELAAAFEDFDAMSGEE